MADSYSAGQTDVRKAIGTLKPLLDALVAADKGLTAARSAEGEATANRSEAGALGRQIEALKIELAGLEQQKTTARADLDGIGAEAIAKAAAAESASQDRITAAQAAANEAETAATAAKAALSAEVETARQRNAAEVERMQAAIAARKKTADDAVAAAEKRLADATAAIAALKAKF